MWRDASYEGILGRLLRAAQKGKAARKASLYGRLRRFGRKRLKRKEAKKQHMNQNLAAQVVHIFQRALDRRLEKHQTKSTKGIPAHLRPTCEKLKTALVPHLGMCWPVSTESSDVDLTFTYTAALSAPAHSFAPFDTRKWRCTPRSQNPLSDALSQDHTINENQVLNLYYNWP